MRTAFLCYLVQASAADRYRQAPRDTPARAPRRSRQSRPSPRARGLPAVMARRLRTMLGGSP
jgi:hypothetical protein